MATIKTDAELYSQVQAGIKVNSGQQITPPIHKSIEDNIIASKLSIRDGGLVVEALTGYTTELTLTDRKHFAYKGYVDDSITALGLSGYLKTDGSNQMLGDLNVGSSNIINVAGIYDLSVNAVINIDQRHLLYNNGTTIAAIWANNGSTGFGINSQVTLNRFAYLKNTNLSTNRTWEFPDSDGTFVGVDATQTLTNKTLTSPVINVGSDADYDMYYRLSGALTRISKGASPDGYVLTLVSGAPAWAAASGGGVTTIGTFDSETPSADALVISGSNIYAQSASATNPGMVNNTTQTFSGAKTFNSAATFTNDALFSSAKGIKDVNGNYLLQFPTAVASAVNYFTLSNSATGNDVSFGVASGSSDTNVNIIYSTKGSGVHRFNNAIHLNNGTSYVAALSAGSTTLSVGAGFSTTIINGTAISLQASVSNIFGINVSRVGSIVATSSDFNSIRVNDSFVPGASSTATYRALLFSGTINQGSGRTGANNALIYANPTITNLQTDFSFIYMTSSMNEGSGVYGLNLVGTAWNYLAGNTGVGTAPTSSAFISIGAGTTAKAQFNYAASSAPTSPNDGDFWFDGTDVKIRIGGVTKTFVLV